MRSNTFAGIVGAVLVGGLGIVGLIDYEQAPSGPNQGLQIALTGLDNFYQTLEGKGSSEQYPSTTG